MVIVMRKCAFLLLLCVMVGYASFSSRAADVRMLNIGDSVPEFPEDGQWFAGEARTLAELKGNKAVMLYFLKPGCGSCDQFAPHLYRLALRYRDDLDVIALTAYPEGEVREYAASRLGTYPVLRLQNYAYIQRYIGNISQFPYLALIDKEGVLRWYGRGKFHAQVTEEVERVLGKKEVAEASQGTGRRLALVVGVADGLGKLAAPEGAAASVAQALKEAGYDEVLSAGFAGANESAPATADNVQKLLESLLDKADKEDVVLFYFSGDAKQVGAEKNFSDIELLLPGGVLTLRRLHESLLAKLQERRVLWVVDANQSDSLLDVWEDIAEEAGRNLSGVTLLLAAARWDRSNLLEGDPAGTVFTRLFIDSLKDGSAHRTVYDSWRFIREGMNKWSRPHGTLQTPFISGRSDAAYGLLPPGEAEDKPAAAPEPVEPEKAKPEPAKPESEVENSGASATEAAGENKPESAKEKEDAAKPAAGVAAGEGETAEPAGE